MDAVLCPVTADTVSINIKTNNSFLNLQFGEDEQKPFYNTTELMYQD